MCKVKVLTAISCCSWFKQLKSSHWYWLWNPVLPPQKASTNGLVFYEEEADWVAVMHDHHDLIWFLYPDCQQHTFYPTHHNLYHTYKLMLYIAHPGVCCGCYVIGHQCCNVRLLLKTLSLSTYLQQFALNNPDTVQHLWGQSHRYIGRDSTDQVPVPGVDQRGTRPARHRNHTMHSDSLSWIYLSK